MQRNRSGNENSRNEAISAVVNGRVWTGDPWRPRAEAVAIDGDRILAVGTTDEVRSIARGGRELDAAGGLIAPGFIDAHLHMIAGGFRLGWITLGEANSRAAFHDRIRGFVVTRPRGTWILGGDWDHERWGGTAPARDWIDAASPDHPVWVTRVDSHMALANSRALTLAGITRATPDVAGGEIVRDDRGEPTGLLKDNAMQLVERIVPSPTAADEDAALDAALRLLASNGITSAHHMGALPPAGSWHEVQIFRRAHARRRLTTRLYVTVPLDTWPRLRDLIAAGDLGGDDGRGDDWLRVGGLKSFIDGSLGSRTAAFHQPYDDVPGDGLFMDTVEHWREWMIDADRACLQLITHAIGDRANTTLLDLYTEVTAANGARDRRLRVEHAQHLTPADIPRLAAIGAIASMQPQHAIDDGRWIERAIGHERARTSYAWRSLRNAGTRLAFGSDWFVAPPVPLAGIQAATSGWRPDQHITLEDALRGYTVEAAHASFEEGKKGRLSEGLLADIVVLDQDIFEKHARLEEARVEATIVGGELIFAR